MIYAHGGFYDALETVNMQQPLSGIALASESGVTRSVLVQYPVLSSAIGSSAAALSNPRVGGYNHRGVLTLHEDVGAAEWISSVISKLPKGMKLVVYSTACFAASMLNHRLPYISGKTAEDKQTKPNLFKIFPFGRTSRSRDEMSQDALSSSENVRSTSVCVVCAVGEAMLGGKVGL